MAALVVSVHDVSPLTVGTCECMLRDLSALGITKTSLLVIPNHHWIAPLPAHPAFCAWLKSQVEAGHEAVLHGYHHLRTRRREDSWRRRFTTEMYTAGEGEFYDLSAQAATHLLRAGLDDLRFLPDPIVGFVAPAWLLGAQAALAVSALGFRYTTSIRKLQDLGSGRVLAARSLVWSTRSAVRRQVSLGWNWILTVQVQQHDLVRIGLHPPDYGYPKVWRQAQKLIRRLARNRRVVTYREAVENPTVLPRWS